LGEQDGPISYIESTTISTVFDEDANRCLLLTTDERPSQTRRIIQSIASSDIKNSEALREQIVDKHHALQRMLNQATVVVPYAERFAEMFNTTRVEARRAFPQALSMVKTISLLHQRQRQTDSNGRIVADQDDYEVAHYLLTGPLSRSIGGGLSDPAARFFDRLSGYVDVAMEFTSRDIRAKESSSDRSVKNWINELAEAGGIEMTQEHRGSRPAAWKLTGMTASAANQNSSPMPSIEQLFIFSSDSFADKP